MQLCHGVLVELQVQRIGGTHGRQQAGRRITRVVAWPQRLNGVQEAGCMHAERACQRGGALLWPFSNPDRTGTVQPRLCAMQQLLRLQARLRANASSWESFSSHIRSSNKTSIANTRTRLKPSAFGVSGHAKHVSTVALLCCSTGSLPWQAGERGAPQCCGPAARSGGGGTCLGRLADAALRSSGEALGGPVCGALQKRLEGVR